MLVFHCLNSILLVTWFLFLIGYFLYHSGSRPSESKPCIENTFWNWEAVKNIEKSNNMVHCSSSTIKLCRLYFHGCKWYQIVFERFMQWRWAFFFLWIITFFFLSKFRFSCSGCVGWGWQNEVVLLGRNFYSKLLFIP